MNRRRHKPLGSARPRTGFSFQRALDPSEIRGAILPALPRKKFQLCALKTLFSFTGREGGSYPGGRPDERLRGDPRGSPRPGPPAQRRAHRAPPARSSAAAALALLPVEHRAPSVRSGRLRPSLNSRTEILPLLNRLGGAGGAEGGGKRESEAAVLG